MTPERAGALTCAMALVPGLYGRNKLFGFFRDPVVMHARSRARLIRSVIRQLATGTATKVVATRGVPCIVTYEVPSLHMSRRVELSELELACLSFLAARSKIAGFPLAPGDRASLDVALATLPTAPRLDAHRA